MTTVELLDMIKDQHGLSSDNQVSKLLECSRQDVSNWRRGYMRPTPYHRSRIAAATGINLEVVNAIVELEKEKNPERIKWWRKVLTGAATVILSIAAMFSPDTAYSAIEPSNSQYVQPYVIDSVDIMRTVIMSLLVLAYILYGL